MADTARLILQVDAAVQLAQSNLRALANTVEGESKNYDKSVARMEGAHARLNNSMGASRNSMMEMQHVFRAMGDSVAAGQDPVRAFIMELGRVGQAAEGLGQAGALGTFGKFIGGPWGMALSAGIAMLASYGGEFMKSGDKVAEETEKLKKNAAETKVAEQAKAAFERTAEGAAAAIHKETAELDKQNRSLMDNAAAQIASLRAKREAVVADRGQIPIKEALAQRDVDNARRELAAAQAMPSAGKAAAEVRGAAIQRANSDLKAGLDKIAALQADANNYDKSIAEADRGIREALLPVIDRRVEANGDPAQTAIINFQNAMDKLKKQAGAGVITLLEYTRAEQRLMDVRDEAIEAAKKHRGPGAATLERDAESAATRAAYLKRWLEESLPGVSHITTTEHTKYVAGTKRISDHYNGQAIDFVPPGGVNSMTKDQVRQLFEAAGMKIRFNASGVEQLFGPWMGTGTALGRAHQNHIHAGVEGTPPGPGTMAHRLEAAAEKAARDEEAYQQLVARAEEQLLNATKSRSNTAEEAEAIDLAGIATERSRQQSAVQAMVAEKRITQEQADYLIAIYRRTASAKVQAVSEKTTERVIAEQNEEQRIYLSGMVTLLQLQEGLATTTAERKKVALQILQYEEDMARAALREKLAKEQDPATKRNLQSQLNQIDAQHPLKVASINQRNADPLTAYMQQLRANTGDMNEALKGVEVDGLKSLEDGILGVINGTETLAGAFKKMASSIIADLARIAIEKGILSLISMFSGGGGGGFGDLGAFKGAQDSSGLAFAAGGSPPVGLASLVGEKGPELFVPKVPGVIIPNHMLGGKGGGGVAFNIQIDAKGAEIGVEQKIAAALVQVAPQFIAAAHRHTMGSLSRRGING